MLPWIRPYSASFALALAPSPSKSRRVSTPSYCAACTSLSTPSRSSRSRPRNTIRWQPTLGFAMGFSSFSLLFQPAALGGGLAGLRLGIHLCQLDLVAVRVFDEVDAGAAGAGAGLPHL